MGRARRSDAVLDFEPEATSISGNRQEAWSEVERSIVKAALSAGVRRCADLGLLPAELTDARARAVWAGILKRIEAGARIVMWDGALVAEVGKLLPLERARESVAWVKGAVEESDDDAVDALLMRVRDRAFCSRVYSLGASLRAAAEDGTPDAAAKSARIIRELFDADESRQSTSAGPDLTSVLDGWDQYIKEAATVERAGKGAVFGLPGVDRWVRMPPCTITVVGAETNVGKSTLAAGAVLASALRGIPSALVSVEDPWSQLAAKMAAKVGRVNPREPLSEQPALDLTERIQDARAKLVGVKAWGCQVRDRSLDGVLAAIRMATAKGCTFVAVDYLTAIRRPAWVDRRAPRREWTDEILGVLIATAAERKVTLLLTSQFNREKGRNAPTVHDLKESGSIGDSAQNVVLLHRDKESVICTVAKVKDGPGVGRRVRLVLDDYGCFAEQEFTESDKEEF